MEQGAYMGDELGPLLVAPQEYLNLRCKIREALGFPTERRALLIGVDGLDGAGKSSVAAWLSWQLEMPAINLDLYIIRDTEPLAFRSDHLNAAVDSCLSMGRPVIVEGVMLLDVLDSIGRRPDFLVFVEKENRNDSNMRKQVPPYLKRRRPREGADWVLEWSSAEHDAKVARAHLRSIE
jgi:hypothetical protein